MGLTPFCSPFCTRSYEVVTFRYHGSVGARTDVGRGAVLVVVVALAVGCDVDNSPKSNGCESDGVPDCGVPWAWALRWARRSRDGRDTPWREDLLHARRLCPDP